MVTSHVLACLRGVDVAPDWSVRGNVGFLGESSRAMKIKMKMNEHALKLDNIESAT